MDNRVSKIRGFDMSIFLVGKQFYDAANHIPTSERYSAYIVNMAFAIELFIKSLDVTNTAEFESGNPFSVTSQKKVHTRVKGHSLLDMFKKLPDPLIVALNNNYETMNDICLENDLESIKNAFLDYRYVFEKESVSVNISAMERVASFFKNDIESIYR